MKQPISYFMLSIILTLVILLGGCAKPPKAEMEAAENALARAENDPDAAAYAESSLVKARNAVAQMRDAANRKRYGEAKIFADEAVSAAERAISEGKAAGQRAREEAAALVETLKETLTETENALDNAQKVEEVELDFTAISQDLDGTRTTLTEAEMAVADNRTEDAMAKGTAVRSDLTTIQNTIVDGVRAATRKK